MTDMLERLDSAFLIFLGVALTGGFLQQLQGRDQTLSQLLFLGLGCRLYQHGLAASHVLPL